MEPINTLVNSNLHNIFWVKYPFGARLDSVCLWFSLSVYIWFGKEMKTSY